MKVLVAEDDPVMREMMGALLSRRGVPCTLAENGERVVHAWETGEFDIIFMDVQMPYMDGLEASRIIREKESVRGGHVPIIAMTAHTMPEDKKECADAGMDDYISKPIVFDEFFSLMERYGRREGKG